MSRFLARVQLAVVVASCTLALVSCSAEQGDWDATIAADLQYFAEIAPMGDEQKQALADGEVTEAEVHESFERYRACLRTAGYELRDVTQDGPFLNFGIPDEAVQSGADDECYAAEYAGVDLIWQVIENADYGERASMLATCLEQNGVPVVGQAGAATVAEMEDALTEAGVAIDECATSN